MIGYKKLHEDKETNMEIQLFFNTLPYGYFEMTKAGLCRHHPHLLTTTTHLAPKDERDHDQIQQTTKTFNWANARKLALLDDLKRWNLSSGRKNESRPVHETDKEHIPKHSNGVLDLCVHCRRHQN
ncbi:hypothetical protein NC651_034702 [Populus alba x Populus x berolinensis]|nr:hypothetical protein NC651_034702 [Populus alba x Populus x berolinensis]